MNSSQISALKACLLEEKGWMDFTTRAAFPIDKLDLSGQNK
jgi:hypothetical protein